MYYSDFRDMVKEIAVRSWKQNCMGLKSSPDKDALVDGIDKAIDKALQEGHRPKDEVMNWMRLMEEPRSNFFPSLRDEFLSKGKKCCFGWCPNLKSRHQLSMEADKYVQVVAELLKKIRTTHEEALSKTEQKVAAAAVTEFMYFNSRRDVWDEITVALQSLRISSIGVYGEAGVGKTMLVEEIKRKAEQMKLFDDVVMTKVTNNQDMRRIQEEIAHDLDLELADGVTAADRIKTRLTDRKVLVILDDIWATIDLEEVGIPFGNKHRQKLKQPTDKKNEAISSVEEQTKCILLMTCRDRDVLSGDMDAHKIIKVDQLKEEEAWGLFEKIAGEKAKNRMFQRTAKIDEKRAGEQPFAEIDEIVNECNQLPIAIATLASALEDKSLIQWRTTIKKHRLQRPSRSEVPISLYSAIKLRYSKLEGEELKKTLLLCSLMGHNAGIQDLLKYGMCLGLFPKATSIEEARDEALKLVKELRRSPSLLQEGGDNMHFDMHDVIQEVAISIASQENGLLDLGKDAADEDSDDDLFDKKAMKECKWICLSNGDARVASHLPHKLKCPQLTFFHSGNKYPDLKIPDNFFKGADQLRVLGLTKMHFSSIPKSFSLLKNLHTLCLDQSKLGTILVSIMGDLKNLQVLSLVGCDIEELPQETKQLAKLKLLDLSDCTKLQVIPPGILKSLSQLEELYLGNSFDQWEDIKKHDQRRNASLDELTQLKKLTSLEVHIPDINMIPDDLFSIELKRYKIFIGDVWNHWGSSFEHSKTLKLKHDGSIRSDKVKHLSNKVEELHLEKLNGVEDAFNELDQNCFQELKCLHVKNIYLEIEYLFFNPKKEIYGEVLPKLEALFLHNLKRLQKIFHGLFEKESLKKLRIITVTGCDQLKNLFSFSVAKQLLYVQEIRVADCSNIVEIVDDEEGEDANDITAEATDDLIELAARIQCLRLQHLTEFISFSQEKIIRSRSTSLFNEKLVAGRRIWNLTKLIVEGCDQLENLFSKSIVECLEKLQHLEIRECKKMTAIVVSHFFFPSLKQLAIENCPELNGFESDKYFTGTALFDRGVYFPALEAMSISKLKNLNTIWWAFESFFGRPLNFLRIKDLPKLTRLLTILKGGPLHYKRFEHLEQLIIENCPQLDDSLFDEEFEFPELKIMTISHLENLKIIEKNLAEDSFCKLRSLRVTCCQNLSTIFPCNKGIPKKLSGSLKELEITGCSLVKEVFELGQSDITGQADEAEEYESELGQSDITGQADEAEEYESELGQSDIAGQAEGAEEYELIFQQLEAITIADCPNMVTFVSTFPRDQEQETSEAFFSTKVEFPNLESLDIEDCHRFKYLMTLSTVQSSPELKTLVIQGCKKMEEVIETEELAEEFAEENTITLFPKLEGMELEDLPELTRFCSQPQDLPVTTVFVFPEVTNLKLSKLPKLASFLPKNVTDWPKLTEMHVCECDQVQIFALEFPTGANQSESQTQHPLFWVNKVEFSKLELLVVEGCGRLKYLMTFSMVQRFLQLKRLVIRGCEKMEEVIMTEKFTENRISLFPKLDSMELEDLPELTRFCSQPQDLPVTTLFVFPEVTDLKLSKLSKLASFFPKNATEWPKLTSMHVCECDREQIFAWEFPPGGNQLESQTQHPLFWVNKVEFSKLELLVVEGCGRLKYLMMFSMVQRFSRLKRLVIRGCEKMEEVIMTEKFTEKRISLFPKLDSMELEDLPELTRFCTQPQDLPVTTLFVFPEVTNLKFSKLPKLASFSPSNATEWPKLTSLHVYECDHVQIFASEFPNGGNQLESQTQHPLFWVNKGVKGQEGSSGSNSTEFPAISFVNLRTIEVSRCHGLITLLRYTIAKRLAKLSTMSITDCSKLEEILACEGNEGKDEIVFTQLTSLRLVLLSRLESFCSGKCNFSFPSLHEVILSECPKMSNFSKGVVKTEKLLKVKLTEEDDVGIWKDGNLNSSIQHLFINKALSSILVCATGKNAGGANAINVDIEKENGQEKEENEDNGFDVNEPKGEIYVSLDDSDPSVAQDAQESASKRVEVVLSSKEKKRGEEAPIASQYAQEQASKRVECTPIVVRDAQEPAKKRAEVASSAQCITSRLLGNYTIEEESKELSKSVGFDTVLLEKASELKSTLSNIEGLTEDEKDTALSRLPDHPLQMLVFYSLSPDQRLAWVRRFLIDH